MIISILNQKGGCGKTTLALNLASYYAKSLNKFNFSKVSLIDTDPQRSLTNWHSTGDPDLEILPLDQPSMLKRLNLNQDHLYILDGSPRTDEMCIASIKISDFVVVPIQPSMMDSWSVAPISKMICERQEITDGSPMAAYVVTRSSPNSKLEKKLREEFNLADNIYKILNSFTSDRVIYKKTIKWGESVFDEHPSYSNSEKESLKKAQVEIESIAIEILKICSGEEV